MIRLFFYIVVLFVSVWLGLKISASPGYVLLSYQHWAVETSLWVAIAAVFVTFSVLYLLLRFLSKVWGVQATFRQWAQHHRERKARRLTSKGLRALAEGNWKQAEKALVKGASDVDSPLINYLAAANAAQGEGSLDLRDQYLRRALESTENSEIAVGLTQAQLQFENAQLEQSLATLEHLNRLEPNHRYVLKLLQRVYVSLEDWDGVLQVLPKLRKYKVLDPDAIDELERQAYRALFKLSIAKTPKDELAKSLKKLPKHLHADPEVVLAYSGELIKNDMNYEAEKILYHAIQDNWHPRLIRQYANVISPKPAKQLSTAEGWLKRYPDDPNLLITLGQLCLRNKLWGKAQRFFETALAKQASVEVLKDLGEVYEQLGQQEQAMECFKKGLAMASSV